MDHLGYRSLAAASGRYAIKLAIEHMPDIIVLDVKLPDIDGFAVCRVLKADPRTATIPVILLTGFGDTPAKLEGFACGASDYMAKPFEIDELAARLHVRLLDTERHTALATENRSLRDALAVLVEGDLANGSGYGHNDQVDASPLQRRWHTNNGELALTPLEYDVLQGFIAGLTQPQIAVLHCVSVRTVQRTTEALKGKLGVTTISAATAQAARLGLLS